MPVKDIEWERYNAILADGGAQYAETNLNHFIVEPWNALSSLFFLVPAIYWAIKIRKNIKENGFIAYCVPLLTLGGLGSTFFHAFRSSPLLLWMDVLPILILTLSVSAYLWQRIIKNWIVTLILILGILFLRKFVVDINYFSPHTAVNISYVISGVTFFLPALIIAFKTKFYKFNSIFLSILLFTAALFFREIDARNIHIFSMGTHFLWHICCAAGGFYLAEYLFHINLSPAQIAYNQLEESARASLKHDVSTAWPDEKA